MATASTNFWEKAQRYNDDAEGMPSTRRPFSNMNIDLVRPDLTIMNEAF